MFEILFGIWIEDQLKLISCSIIGEMNKGAVEKPPPDFFRKFRELGYAPGVITLILLSLF